MAIWHSVIFIAIENEFGFRFPHRLGYHHGYCIVGLCQGYSITEHSKARVLAPWQIVRNAFCQDDGQSFFRRCAPTFTITFGSVVGLQAL